jgi:uncharacterized protein
VTADQQRTVVAIAEDVRQQMSGEASGHDWWHVDRVWQNAKLIARDETVDQYVVELAALLHDLGDPKLHDGEDRIEPMARECLERHQVDHETAEKVITIITTMSFSKTVGGNPADFSLEAKVVQDADRLDALGAIGIARLFAYGGKNGREIYNPEIPAKLPKDSAEYAQAKTTSYNHFHDKILLLKDRMTTDAGRRVADGRHRFVEEYLEQFKAEVNGER